MHGQLTSHPTRALQPPVDTSPALVVFTAVDGAIREGASGTCASARHSTWSSCGGNPSHRAGAG